MNQLPCGHLVLDDRRFIVEVNDEALRLLGVKRDEAVGAKLSKFLAPGSRIFFQTHVFPELALRGRVDELYLSVSTSAGELPVLLNASLRDDASAPGYDLVFLPIFRRALFERELLRAKEQADEASASERRALAEVETMQAQLNFADRLATVGTLAAGVAHEVNNPLAYIIANLEVLRDMITEAQGTNEPITSEWLELADEALDGSLRIRDIVGDMKMLARNDAPRGRPVELSRVIDAALRLSSPSLRTHAEVEVDLQARGLVVLGDEGRLVQVVVNLLLNAAQALPQRLPQLNRILVRLHANAAGQPCLEVIDNGPGIPAALVARVFDPFFTTKGSGTGLGLSVCHGIMTDLGGRIDVESQEGSGATFRLVFPRALSVELSEARSA